MRLPVGPPRRLNRRWPRRKPGGPSGGRTCSQEVFGSGSVPKSHQGRGCDCRTVGVPGGLQFERPTASLLLPDAAPYASASDVRPMPLGWEAVGGAKAERIILRFKAKPRRKSVDPEVGHGHRSPESVARTLSVEARVPYRAHATREPSHNITVVLLLSITKVGVTIITAIIAKFRADR